MDLKTLVLNRFKSFFYKRERTKKQLYQYAYWLNLMIFCAVTIPFAVIDMFTQMSLTQIALVSFIFIGLVIGLIALIIGMLILIKNILVLLIFDEIDEPEDLSPPAIMRLLPPTQK